MTSPAGSRRLLFSAAAKWGSFAVQMAVAFVMSPLLIRALGDQRYGVWTLIDSVLAYLMLFDLGLAASLVRYVARFEADSDQERINRVFSTCMMMGLVAGAAVLLLTFGLIFGVGQVSPTATAPTLRVAALAGTPVVAATHLHLMHEGRWMLALLGVNLALGLPLRSYTCVLEGLGHYPVQAAIRTGSILVRTGLMLLVIWYDGGLVAIAAAVTAFNLLEHLLSALAARVLMPGLRFSFRLADRETFRLIRGYSLYACLAMIAGRISFQSDAIVIGVYLAASHITFFSIAVRLIENAKDSLHVATTVLTPAASQMESQGNEVGLRRMLLESTRYVVWIILPIQAGLMLLGGSFIALWVGPEYVATSYPTLIILAVPLGFAMAQSVSVRFLYGLGRLKWYARLMLAEAGTNLILSIVLVQRLGIEGVALGTAIPNLIANVVVMVMICRILNLSVGDYVRQVFARPLLAVAPLALGWGAVVLHGAPVTWGAFLLVGALGAAGYGMVAALLEFGPRAVWGWVRRRETRAMVSVPARAQLPRACVPSGRSRESDATGVPAVVRAEST